MSFETLYSACVGGFSFTCRYKFEKYAYVKSKLDSARISVVRQAMESYFPPITDGNS